MFTFITEDGSEYEIRFRYLRKKNGQPYGVQAFAKFEGEFVALETSKCHENDEFIKATGRILAFARLVGREGGGLKLSRVDRTTAFEAYYFYTSSDKIVWAIGIE